MNQLSFPLDLSVLPRARARDPATSHAAANRARELQAAHSLLILEVLRKYGPAGKDRIGQRAGLSGPQVARRTFELAGSPVNGIPTRKALIRDSGRTEQSASGRAERVWECL